MNFLFHIGRFFSFIVSVFGKPEKYSVYIKNLFVEIYKLGVGSISIVFIISIFMGAVIGLQTAYNMGGPFLPMYIVSLTTRDSMILEFSSSVVGLILAGKVGSNIASEIGTMRVTQQIDALEIMGINPVAFLVRPKILAMVLFSPILTIISIFIGISGGYLSTVCTGIMSNSDFVYGLHYAFVPFYITYTLVKALFFSFIYTSVPAYFGYHVSGGALEVGRASTKAVVVSSVLILIFNLILTQLLLG